MGTSTRRPGPILYQVPGPHPGTVGRDLAGSQRRQAPLPERAGLLGFMETSGPPEEGTSGVAPLR